MVRAALKARIVTRQVWTALVATTFPRQVSNPLCECHVKCDMSCDSYRPIKTLPEFPALLIIFIDR